MWFLIALGLFLLAIALYRIWQRVAFPGVLEIPGPYPWPFLGSVTGFGFNEKYFYIRGMENQRIYGPIYKVWSPWFTPYLVVSDADVLEYFMSSMKFITKSKEYGYFDSWLGTGLVTGSGEKWQKRRKALTPAFHFKILEQFTDVFNSTGDVLVQQFSKELNNDSFDVYKYVKNWALDVLCESAMGTSINAQTCDSHYIKAVKEYLNIILKRKFRPTLSFGCFFKLTNDYKKQNELVEIMHNFTESVIIKRREELVNGQNGFRKEKEEGDSKKKRVAFLDLLLKTTIDGKPLSNEDIREEVDTFMFAGHDTVASTVSFVLYEIAQHPDVQDKIVEELNTIYQNKTNDVLTYNDLQEMEYIQLVIKETLRFFPPVGIYEREITEDGQFGKLRYHAGTVIVINPYELHRDPRHFPDPEAFIPKRFTKENMNGKHPFCYLPFSAGPRNCIGQKFAMLEMKAAVAKIIRKYKLCPVPGHKLDIFNDTIVKSLTGCCIKIELR